MREASPRTQFFKGKSLLPFPCHCLLHFRIGAHLCSRSSLDLKQESNPTTGTFTTCCFLVKFCLLVWRTKLLPLESSVLLCICFGSVLQFHLKVQVLVTPAFLFQAGCTLREAVEQVAWTTAWPRSLERTWRASGRPSTKLVSLLAHFCYFYKRQKFYF